MSMIQQQTIIRPSPFGQRSLACLIAVLLPILAAMACGAGRAVPASPTLRPTAYQVSPAVTLTQDHSVADISAGWYRRTIGGGGAQTGIAIDPGDSDIVYVTTDNGGIIKSTDGGQVWRSINHNIGNRLLADVEMDPLNPAVLYVLAEVFSESPTWSDDPVNGELYRTSDGGASWELVFAEGMGTSGRCFGVSRWPSTRSLLLPFDPADPDRYDGDADGLTDVIYVGGWDSDPQSADRRAGVWMSTDEGADFEQIALADANIWVLKQDPADPNRLYAGTHGSGLYVSSDAGLSWEHWSGRIPIPMISDLAILPGSETIYVATNAYTGDYSGDEFRTWRGVYRSTDGGQNFEIVSSGLGTTSLNLQVLLLDQTDPTGRTLYTGPFGGPDKGIYMSTDGGDSWSKMDHELSENPPWFGGFDNLWAMQQAPDGTLFASTWRGIYRYDIDRQRWQIRSDGLGNIAVETIAFAPGLSRTIYLGIRDSTPWKSIDGGAHWFRIGDGFTTTDGEDDVNASDIAVSMRDSRILYATGVGSSGSGMVSAVLKSIDSGNHWIPVPTGLPATSTDNPTWQAVAIAVSSSDPNTAFVALEMASEGGRIFKTTDGAAHWHEILSLPQPPTAMAISRTLAETVVLGTEWGRVYVGSNGGTEWQSYDLAAGKIHSVAVSPTDPTRFLVGVNVRGAFLSSDGGRSWRHVFDDQDLGPFIGDMALSSFARERYAPTIKAVMFDRTDSDTLYIGHDAGIWMGIGLLKSTDGGQEWFSVMDDTVQMRSVSDFDQQQLFRDLAVGTWDVYYHFKDDVEFKHVYLPILFTSPGGSR